MSKRNFHDIGRSVVYSLNGIAATSHPLATHEAIDILKRGGNAIDAAIAANIVLAVVEPQSTGIGGDCFSLIHLPGAEKPIAINGSGKAPSYLDHSFFSKQNLDKIPIDSPHSVTIPGCVDAWGTMSKNYGRLPWAELFKNAISYARKGFVVHERIAFDWEDGVERLKNNKNSRELFLKEGNKSYCAGELFKNEKLGNTLEIIAKNGPRAFYEGEIAEDIVNSLQDLGGKHNLEDFKAQDTILTEPISINYRDVKLFQCPPNNQGITALIMMKILEEFQINQYEPMSFERLHLEAEASKIAYLIRDLIIADPKVIHLSEYEKYLTPKTIEKYRKMISLDKCLDVNLETKEKGPWFSPDTIYLTVIDQEKNAVSLINSIFYGFGSAITTNNTGIVLHNRGACFSLDHKHPNCISGGKRPLHTIMPGMIYKDKEFMLCYGVMGGQYQPVGQMQFLNNFLEFKMNVQEALNFPRAFHFNNLFQLEERVPKEVEEKLQKVGHKTVRGKTPLGGGQASGIIVKDQVLFAGSDPRKDGCALGY